MLIKIGNRPLPRRNKEETMGNILNWCLFWDLRHTGDITDKRQKYAESCLRRHLFTRAVTQILKSFQYRNSRHVCYQIKTSLQGLRVSWVQPVQMEFIETPQLQTNKTNLGSCRVQIVFTAPIPFSESHISTICNIINKPATVIIMTQHSFGPT